MSLKCELSDLPGLGPKSAQNLNAIGIFTRADLESKGPVKTFLALQKNGPASLNFLYALVGALENRHWQDVAKQDQTRLKLELEAETEFQNILAECKA